MNHISGQNLKLMYFDMVRARADLSYSPNPFPDGEFIIFYAHPLSRMQGMPFFFFVIYQISSKYLQQSPDDQSRSHFRCRCRFHFDFDFDSHSHFHSQLHFQSASLILIFILILILILRARWHCEVSIKTKTWDTVTVRVL